MIVSTYYSNGGRSSYYLDTTDTNIIVGIYRKSSSYTLLADLGRTKWDFTDATTKAITDLYIEAVRAKHNTKRGLFVISKGVFCWPGLKRIPEGEGYLQRLKAILEDDNAYELNPREKRQLWRNNAGVVV